MARLYFNNFSTTLDGSITNVATSIDVVDASGLSGVGGGDTCILTIDDGTNIEIVEVTAVSSNTLTIVRGQEGTSGTAFATDVTIECRATASSFIAQDGEIDFGDAESLEIPNSATPTLNADGEVAVDTSVTDFNAGVLKYYGGEIMAVVAMPVAQLTSPTDGYVVTYNATTDDFELQATGVTTDYSAQSTFLIPVSATPTITTNGHVAVDTTVSDWSHGIYKYYGGEEMGIVAMPIAEFTSPSDGDTPVYNATNDEFEMVPNDPALVLNAKTDSYSVVAADRNALITVNAATAKTVTLPDPNTVVDGFQVAIVQRGAGTVSIATASGTIESKDSNTDLAAQHSMAVAVKLTSTIWGLYGDLA